MTSSIDLMVDSMLFDLFGVVVPTEAPLPSEPWSDEEWDEFVQHTISEGPQIEEEYYPTKEELDFAQGF